MCHEYGWTIDQWFSHTPREIALLINASNKRRKNDEKLKHAEFQFHAWLHGQKYEMPNLDLMDKIHEMPDDKERDERIKAYMMERMAQKEKEFTNG